MKVLISIVTIVATICFLIGCATTDTTPDINSLKPSQQDQDRAKLSNGIMS